MVVPIQNILLKTLFSVVDSQIAKESNIGVQEMVNGCMCCVLVGQMKLALQELKGKKHVRQLEILKKKKNRKIQP